MKYKVKIVEVIEHVREVEAKDYNDLKVKLDEDRESTGKCIQTETTEEMYCEIHDENGNEYKKVRFI
jgi:hypothetical protein